MGTTPTTPSEWGQIKIDVDEVLYDLTDHTLTFDEASAMMLKIVKQILHHNTEDIIEKCAQVASAFSMESHPIHPDIPADKMNDKAHTAYHATAQCIAEEIRALKPTHKV